MDRSSRYVRREMEEADAVIIDNEERKIAAELNSTDGMNS